MNLPQQRLLGQVVADRYRVLEVLGEGGMGAVYLAEHLTLHKQVALKVVHREHAGNAELAARFAREAMATSRIEHPNVISALDYGQLDDGTAYLAVQLVRGPSLTRVLRAEGPMHWARVANIGAQIADALSAAHGHGIVHRDLKPDNVLLQFLDDGTELVKVLDFGVAKFTPMSNVPDRARADVTQIGFVVGTPGYMAPEQATGAQSDARVDLYSLGVILWECATGRNLWTAPNLPLVVARQLEETPQRLSAMLNDPALPPQLEDLVSALLAARPEGRPADAASVRDALRAICKLDENGGRRVQTGSRPLASSIPPAPSQGAVERRRSVPPPPTTTANDAPRAGLAQAQRGRRIAWGVAGMMLLVLGTLVGMLAGGLVELHPKGEVAAVARRVADGLNLPSVTSGSLDAKVSVSSARTGLPAALEPSFDRLIDGAHRDERVEAAAELLSHQPVDDVPLFVRRMAYLQLAKTCPEKRSEVVALRALHDVRALPLLMQLAERPREGCGKKKKEDCLGCLRVELEAAVQELGGPATVQPEPVP
jgi:serine/threonine-protein kinase